MFSKIINYFIEETLIVVHNGPSAPPTRNTVYFAESASANNGHCLCHLAHRVEGALIIVAESVVDLIGYDWKSVFIGNCKDFLDMRLSEARSARV